MSGFFEFVEKESNRAYAQLEGNPVLNELFQGRLSSDAYKRVLAAFYEFYAFYEFRLVRAHVGDLAGPLFYTHLKTPLLEADLEVLDHRIDRCQLPALSDHSAAPMDTARALGTWYVLEKATFLWSRLTKVLKRKYGIDAATGLAFFTNYGNRFEYFWDDFHVFVTSQVRQPMDRETFVLAANRTLLCLDAWLRRRICSTETAATRSHDPATFPHWPAPTASKDFSARAVGA